MNRNLVWPIDHMSLMNFRGSSFRDGHEHVFMEKWQQYLCESFSIQCSTVLCKIFATKNRKSGETLFFNKKKLFPKNSIIRNFFEKNVRKKKWEEDYREIWTTQKFLHDLILHIVPATFSLSIKTHGSFITLLKKG